MIIPVGKSFVITPATRAVAGSGASLPIWAKIIIFFLFFGCFCSMVILSYAEIRSLINYKNKDIEDYGIILIALPFALALLVMAISVLIS